MNKGKIVSKILVLFVLLIGSTLSIIGGMMIHKTYHVILTGEYSEGIIIDFSREKVKTGHSNINQNVYRPIVEYKCLGLNYREASRFTKTPNMSIGDTVKLYCIKDLFIIENGSDKHTGFIPLFFGLLILYIVIISYKNKIKREKIIKDLLYNGDSVQAVINFIGKTKNSSKEKNHNFMYFSCEYLNKDENKKYEYKSEYFHTSSLNKYLKIGMERKVYINKNDLSQYYILRDDIDIFLSNNI